MLQQIYKNLFISSILAITLTTFSIEAHGTPSSNDKPFPSPPSVYATSKSSTFATGYISLGFGLSVMAALSSALGSFLPLLDHLFPHIPGLRDFSIAQSKGFLAASLSFSAGILLFLTLGDLYPEAIESFQTSGLFDEKYANIVAASVFVVTVVIIMIMKAVFSLSHGHGISEAAENGNGDVEVENKDEKINKNSLTVIKSQDAHKLKNLGIQIAIALAIHNFPEGLSTFATAIAAPQIGIIYAIALSKIPEGIIISLPIYYATGSRWKAFVIAASIGVISQMLGATLGYVLFVTVWNSAVSGFLFSMVTGALLYVILHGMLPLARHYDPTDKYCTYYACGGLFFFAIVASLFTLQS
ncbi:24737_t:CDS:2 [Gigaspora margarita]|uniref:24737_t:CDS:1 n=1 Tax=Gigaspora margarita TaxID=4874 RepID=A0ABM8W2F7_GIGMA|nr:24737_t:CDS:2 [Gigaspora margarita]